MSFPHAYILHRGAVIIRYEIVLGGALYTKEFWRCFWNSFFLLFGAKVFELVSHLSFKR